MPAILHDLALSSLHCAAHQKWHSGGAYGVAAVVKGLGIGCLKTRNVVATLEAAAASSSAPSKQGALFAFECLCARLKLLFEPYVQNPLGDLLVCVSVVVGIWGLERGCLTCMRTPLVCGAFLLSACPQPSDMCPPPCSRMCSVVWFPLLGPQIRGGAAAAAAQGLLGRVEPRARRRRRRRTGYHGKPQPAWR